MVRVIASPSAHPAAVAAPMEAQGIVSVGAVGHIAFVDDTTVCSCTGNGLVFVNVESGRQVRHPPVLVHNS